MNDSHLRNSWFIRYIAFGNKSNFDGFSAVKAVFMKKPIVFIFLVFVAVSLTFSPAVRSQGFSQTDFIVADAFGNRIAVYDQNLVFLRYLDTTIIEPWGLTILANGNLAAVGRNDTPGVGRIRVYAPTGAIVADFTDANIGNPVDIKSLSGVLYCPQDNVGGGIAKFTSGGTFTGTLGSGAFFSAAILSGNVLWAGNTTNTISVFDLSTNSQTGSFVLDNGQVQTNTMYYSAITNTVLMTGSPTFNTVYERDITGAFVRQFVVPAGEFVNFGVTRGPGNDVFATVLFGSKVHRWNPDGTFVSSTDIPQVSGPANIVWAGGFAPTAANASVQGRVLDENGQGIGSATVTLADTEGGSRTVPVNPFGYFRFDEVVAGRDYVVTASHKSIEFSPQVINVTDDVNELTITPVARSTKSSSRRPR